MDLQAGHRAGADVAPVPPGQSGVRPPGPQPGTRPARRARLRTLLLVAASALLALGVADWAGVEGPGAADDALRAGLPLVALFALCGLGPTRLLLPARLREHELLWVLPVGACAAALELAVLGYLRVPFAVNLGAVLGANAALAVVAVRRRGLPARPPRVAAIAWPLWIAFLVACLALVPMFRTGVPTVQGVGSDAHLAAGTAHFLKGHAPGSVAVEEPVDQVPLVWRSKPPIHYPMAAASALSGMETWEVFATVLAVMGALAALGFFLLAREGLGAGLGGAAAAMAVVGADRVVLQTLVHPYYNQAWGFFALPFALLLALWAVRARTRGAAALLAGFLLVGAFAYPLALPIPLVALAVLLWPERGRLRGVWRGRRAPLWLVPLALVLAVPVRGVIEKAAGAVGVVVDPSASLRSWGGDLTHFIPEHQFVGMPSTTALLLFGPPLLAALVWELRRQPRAVALALGGVLLFGALAAAWFRPRDFGWYFHFKALAFVGPLALLVACVGISRLRRGAGVALGLLVLFAFQGARDEMAVTFDQTARTMRELDAASAVAPDGASIRLDVAPGEQLWIAYFLADHPLCSEQPLTSTSYPHVPVSSKADLILRDRSFGRPPGATGPELWRNERYALFRQAASVPGEDRCSQRMVQTIQDIELDGGSTQSP